MSASGAKRLSGLNGSVLIDDEATLPITKTGDFDEKPTMSSVASNSASRGLLRLAAIASSLLLLTVFTSARSQAAFTDSTDNAGNSWTAGSVTLTDDDSNTALFSYSGWTPTDTASNCIVVTYSGDVLPAAIRLHAITTGGLDDYLDFTVELGTGGSFGNCAGFTPTSTIFSSTLTNFALAHSDYASGLNVFTAATNPTSQTLRITTTLQDNNAAQGLSSTATLTWETQE